MISAFCNLVKKPGGRIGINRALKQDDYNSFACSANLQGRLLHYTVCVLTYLCTHVRLDVRPDSGFKSGNI